MTAARTPRLCFAAVHVVLAMSYKMTGHSRERPGSPEEIAEHVDWQRTMDLRRWIDSCGLVVAEAMDTAQRFAIGWPVARRLIKECGALKLQHGFCAGAGADHVKQIKGIPDLVDGTVEQCAYVDAQGGIPVVLPMPWLVQNRCSERDYVEVYGAVFRAVRGPVFVHWLGPMFAPALEGYFPGDSFRKVMALHPDKVRGCKLSLLDAAFEVKVRRELLARDQIVLTGDDCSFARLLYGGEDVGPVLATPEPTRWTKIGRHDVALGDFSHALLGILDAIALPAGRALQSLAAGNGAVFLTVLRQCELLGQHVFAAPVQHYKAGLAFLAWLNGLQDDFTLVNREELLRDRGYYLRCADLAREASAVRDDQLFAQRLREFANSAWPPA